MRLFWNKLNMYRITVVPYEHQRLRLILNLSAQPDEGTPSVNNTMDREITPESIKFERAFPRILQEIR